MPNHKNIILSFLLLTCCLIFPPSILLGMSLLTNSIYTIQDTGLLLLIHIIVIAPILGIIWLFLFIKIIRKKIWKETYFKGTGIRIIGFYILSIILLIALYAIPSTSNKPYIKEIEGKVLCYSFYTIQSGYDEICQREVISPYGEDSGNIRIYYNGSKGEYIEYHTAQHENGIDWDFKPYVSGERNLD